MLSQYVIKCYYIINNILLRLTNSGLPEGESMKVGFDGSIKLEFHGTKVTSNDGLPAYRDLDKAFVLFYSAEESQQSARTTD